MFCYFPIMFTYLTIIPSYFDITNWTLCYWFKIHSDKFSQKDSLALFYCVMVYGEYENVTSNKVRGFQNPLL